MCFVFTITTIVICCKCKLLTMHYYNLYCKTLAIEVSFHITRVHVVTFTCVLVIEFKIKNISAGLLYDYFTIL